MKNRIISENIKKYTVPHYSTTGVGGVAGHESCPARDGTFVICGILSLCRRFSYPHRRPSSFRAYGRTKERQPVAKTDRSVRVGTNTCARALRRRHANSRCRSRCRRRRSVKRPDRRRARPLSHLVSSSVTVDGAPSGHPSCVCRRPS